MKKIRSKPAVRPLVCGELTDVSRTGALRGPGLHRSSSACRQQQNPWKRQGVMGMNGYLKHGGESNDPTC